MDISKLPSQSIGVLSQLFLRQAGLTFCTQAPSLGGRFVSCIPREHQFHTGLANVTCP